MGKSSIGSPRRKCEALAPPRKPVNRNAPKTEVRGMTYKTVLANRTIPIPGMTLSPYPSRKTVSATSCAFADVAAPSRSRMSAANALMIRRVQTHILDFNTLELPASKVPFPSRVYDSSAPPSHKQHLCFHPQGVPRYQPVVVFSTSQPTRVGDAVEIGRTALSTVCRVTGMFDARYEREGTSQITWGGPPFHCEQMRQDDPA